MVLAQMVRLHQHNNLPERAAGRHRATCNWIRSSAAARRWPNLNLISRLAVVRSSEQLLEAGKKKE